MKEKVLITGGCGFIGSHLAHALVEQDYDVVVIDNLNRGKRDYIGSLIDFGKVRFVYDDVRNEEVVNDIMKDIDYVFHKAAMCINYSLVYPPKTFDVNITGTFNVFKAAYDNKVKKVIFSSSASVYGNRTDNKPMREDDKLNPITPYCISKIAGENMLRMKMFKGLPFIILRYFNVYGVRQKVDAYYTSVINTFIKRILDGLSPEIFGGGLQSMDYINVGDIVKADILAIKSDISDEIYNVGTGRGTSVKDIAKLILELSETNFEPVYKDEGGLGWIVERREANISKITKDLGFKPTVTLKEGLKELFDDVKKHPSNY